MPSEQVVEQQIQAPEPMTAQTSNIEVEQPVSSSFVPKLLIENLLTSDPHYRNQLPS
jgi:hypothetical protein